MQAADLLKAARLAFDADGAAALAIVLRTWGSAPRAAGSLMVIRRDGGFDGSVSGGCVEGDVLARAAAIIAAGGAERLDYSVSNDRAWEVGLACGGSLQILLTAIGPGGLDLGTLDLWQRQLAAGEGVRLLVTGVTVQIRAGDEAASGGDVLSYPPAPRMAIIGAVHIAQALAPMAMLAGHAVQVIDPRTRFATAERFPAIALATGWPDEALAHWGITAGTAVIALTHDPKLDDPALVAALASPAYYVAALGSRKTHAARLERLAAAGCEAEALARIHGPAGLAIGAQTPAEIAIAILAQAIAAYRGTSA